MPGLGRARELPVRLSPVGDLDDGDDADPIADGVEDAVRAETDAVGVRGARELEAALGPRVRGETSNERSGPLAILEAWKSFKFLGCRRLDGDAIAFHCA